MWGGAIIPLPFGLKAPGGARLMSREGAFVLVGQVAIPLPSQGLVIQGSVDAPGWSYSVLLQDEQ